MSRKWADVIHAWAECQPIQYSVDDGQNWQDVKEHEMPGFNLGKIIWRIKPKNITYRLGLFKTPVGSYKVMVSQGTADDIALTSSMQLVRWLTYDQIVEV